MRNVLIACHEDSIVDLLAKHLRDCEVHICETGIDTLEQTELLKPDLLLIHLSLPKTNGLTVLRNLRHRPPVIFALTDLASEPVIEAAANAGVREMVLLPCSISYLHDAIRKYL